MTKIPLVIIMRDRKLASAIGFAMETIFATYSTLRDITIQSFIDHDSENSIKIEFIIKVYGHPEHVLQDEKKAKKIIRENIHIDQQSNFVFTYKFEE